MLGGKMGEAGNWCLIESDPGVFTELIKEFGCTGVQVEEIWSLDQEQFDELEPIHGLIFLFKWEPCSDISGSVITDSRADKIFFAKQVINNACATQAILSILLNCNNPDVKLGSTLKDFQEFCNTFDPTMKGLALSNCHAIRSVHNSFARPTLFEFDTKDPSKGNETFHFVSYIPIDGRLYELDGLKEGPIDIGPIPSGTPWVSLAKPVIENRIKKYTEGEIHFNLMAVVTNKKFKYEKRMVEIACEIEKTNGQCPKLAEELSRLQQLIEEEEEKMKRYRIENTRRKHNYLPLIVEMLKILGNEKELLPLYEKAKSKALAKSSEKQH